MCMAGSKVVSTAGALYVGEKVKVCVLVMRDEESGR